MSVINGRPDLLTQRQTEANRLLGGPAKHVMLYGGSRSGKSWLLVRAIVFRALRVPKSHHAIWRFRFNHCRTSIWLDTLPRVLTACFDGLKVEDSRQDGLVIFPNGSRIFFGGLDDRERSEKILGNEYSSILFEECSQIPYSSVLIAMTRLAQNSGLKLKAYYSENPPQMGHWSYRIFVEHRDPVSKAKLANPSDYAAMLMNPVDNIANLPPSYLASLEALPERQRRRFLEGRFTDDTEGALWTLDAIERCRCTPDDVPRLERVVVAVDPSGVRGADDKRSDEVGIVVAGRGRDGRGYVLDDLSLRATPEQWVRAALAAYDKHQADAIVAERNFGGDMVPGMFRSARPNIPVRVVTASRGKHIRAEPIAALYERDQVCHVGRFATLEDQLLSFTLAGYVGERSPDRADALVHGLTDLMLGAQEADGYGTPVQAGVNNDPRPSDYGYSVAV